MRENTTKVNDSGTHRGTKVLIVSCKREFIRERIYYRCISMARYLDYGELRQFLVDSLVLESFEARLGRIEGMHAFNHC